MSLSRFLNHRVTIVRNVAVLDDEDAPTLDAHGQPVFAEIAIATLIPAGIQSRRAMEVEAINQTGVVVADHRIYTAPTDVTTGDSIVHDATLCPVVTDLPDGTFHVVFAPDGAGAGHHTELEAKLVGTPQRAYALPVGGS